MADENLQDQINRLKKNVSDTYEVLETAGATLPDDKNSDYLDDTAKTVFTGLQALDLSTEESIEVDPDEYEIIEIADEGVHIQQTKTITNNGTYTADDGYNVIKSVEVNVPGVKNQSKTTTVNGVVTPDEGYTGLSDVTVNVDTVKNQNKTVTANGKVTPDEGYTGLGEVTVNVPSTTIKNQDKAITANGTYMADTGYTGLGTVTVSVPSSGGGSSNESNIVMPMVISDDGTWSPSTEPFNFIVPANVTKIGSKALYYAFYENPSLTSVNLNNVTDIDSKGLYYAFYQCSSLSSVSLDNVINVKNSGLSYTFRSCKSLKSTDLNLTSITNIDNYGLYGAFQDCTSLTSVSFGNIESIGLQGLSSTFKDCTSLTSAKIDSLPSAITSYGLYMMFQNCTSLTSIDDSFFSNITEINTCSLGNIFYQCTSLAFGDITFSKLTAIDYSGLQNTFYKCKSVNSISFPALTTTSFGRSTNQFRNMINGVTGCTVHFPSNLESVIGSWDDVTAGFGGTDTIVLFDLPATT